MKKISIKSIAGSSGCIALVKEKNFLYAAGGDILSVYDISKPDNPKLVWKRGGFGNARQLAILDDYLYMTAREYGLWIVDISTPDKPKKVTRFDTVEQATGIAVAKDTVFVAQRIYGIETIDVTNPSEPRHLSLIKTPEAQSCFYNQGLLYVGDWGASCVTIIDVRDRTNPIKIDAVDLGGYGDGVAISNGYCYAATGLNANTINISKTVTKSELVGDGHGLDIFSLNKLGKSLKHVSRINFPLLEVKTNDFWTVRISDNNAFVADTHNGVFQVDVSDPANPKTIGRITLPPIIRMDNRAEKRMRIQVPDCVGDVAIGKGVIYVAGQKTGLHVAKRNGISPEKHSVEQRQIQLKTGVSKRSQLARMDRIEFGGQVRRVALDNNILYAACSHAGIKILQFDRDTTKTLDTISVECAYDVAVSNGRLYVAEGVDGIAVYSLYPECKELGRFKGRKRIFQLLRICGNGKFAACGCRSGMLRILDISNPQKIKQVFNHIHGGILYGDTFPDKDVDNILPVIWPYRGISWYDLSQEKPMLIFDDRVNHLAGQYEGIIQWNGSFLMNTLNKKFHLLNTKDYGKTWIEIPDGCTGVPTADGDIIAFSHRCKGDVNVYHVKKSRAKMIKRRSLLGIDGIPDRVVFYKGRMIVPCGHQGLLIEKNTRRKN